MHWMIREEDRQAMDLIMDRSLTAASKSEGKSVYAAADISIRQRAAKVEKVLELLDNLMVEEPSASLLKRTMRHIAESSGKPVSAGNQSSNSRAFSPPPPFA